ncbi:MAG: succinate dehydrogenase assembly factor 2 [Thiopseudomonas sp.]|jgi:antitoxin CptB|nr:succinate dehydrogenase assembly factor 2 [Gammaproteobacteria bacterium]
MTTETELNRLFWHSRRGMLELDELLVPFVREAYTALADDDKARYEKLLTCEDQDMFAWFMRRDQPQDEDLQIIIEKVLEHSRARRF